MARRLGTPLMPWQQYVVDVALEVDEATGRLAYREVVLLTPRQSGKTSLLLAVAVHRAIGMAAADGPQRIVYTAQNGVYARTKFLDEQVPLLEASPIGKRRPAPFKVRKTNGHEAILWRNGSKHGIAAATEKAGHGGSLDLVLLDEAFAHVDARLEQGLRPTMITRPQPQQWVTSTAGTPDSVYLWGKVEAGRARAEMGLTEGVAYFEWSADPKADPGSLATWQSCMPALGHTVTPAAVAADFTTMELPEFRRAYTNVWDARKAEPVIAEDDWAACAALDVAIEGAISLAFDVAPDRESASIGAAGAAGGRTGVEVIEHRAGTAWVVPRLAELAERHDVKLIACDAAGPAGSLLADAAEAGLDVKVASTRDHQQACGAFYDAVKPGEGDAARALVHRGQAALDAAVEGAERRTVGDAWLWSRRGDTDICPLVAVTLARWAHHQPAPEGGPSVYEERGLISL